MAINLKHLPKSTSDLSEKSILSGLRVTDEMARISELIRAMKVESKELMKYDTSDRTTIEDINAGPYFELKSFKFHSPRLWSSGKASEAKVILNFLSNPNTYDVNIVLKRFGAQSVADTWDQYENSIQSPTAHAISKSLILNIKAC